MFDYLVILWNKISEWHKGTKRLQFSSDFMNKAEERCSTTHLSITYP